MKGRALVTGGAGFIGSHLCERLLEDGWDVYVLDDLSTGSMRNVEHLIDRGEFHLVVDSVLKPAVVNELVNKCDVVYHLAAAVGVRLIVEQPVHTLVTNLEGTEVVLDHCSRFGKRVLVASTSEVYGDHREEEPLAGGRSAASTARPPQRRWAYADSKAMDEYLALAYHQERDLDCVIARLFNTVGPRQSGQYGMVIPNSSSAALAGAPARDPWRRDPDAHLLPCPRHDPGAHRTVGGRARADLQRRLAGTASHPRARRARTRGDRLVVGTRRRPLRPGLRARIEDMLHRIPSIEKVAAASTGRLVARSTRSLPT